MKIIEWFNSSITAESLIYFAIALVVWFIVWHLLISKLCNKSDFIYDLVKMGPILAPIASFGLLVFFAFFILLFIASIQIAFEYGTIMSLMLLAFWGGIVTFFVFLIRHIRK